MLLKFIFSLLTAFINTLALTLWVWSVYSSVRLLLLYCFVSQFLKPVLQQCFLFSFLLLSKNKTKTLNTKTSCKREWMHSTIQVTMWACVQQTYYVHIKPTHTHALLYSPALLSFAVGVCGRTDYQARNATHTQIHKFTNTHIQMA